MKRADGIRVKNEVPMYYLIPHFLPERNDAMNMITLDIPVEPLRRYMNEKRREGKKISHMALLMSAYLYTLADFPSLNRFVINRRIYQHKDIKFSLVVLRPGGANDDTMAKLDFGNGDNLFSVQEKIDKFIEVNSSGEESNLLDKAMNFLCKMNWMMRFLINLARFCDRHNLLPQWLIDMSPFHASVLISNLASIRTNHIYHHIYNFGSTSVSITMGNLREIPRRGKDGTVELERCIPLGVVMDERIASGHYLAMALARLKELLHNPQLMETPVEMKEIQP